MSTKIKTTKAVNVEGVMSFNYTEEGLKTADFKAAQEVIMKEFASTFKMYGARDGNLYLTEMKKRVRNRPIFRDDNSSLSLGRNGKYYFTFSLDEELVQELPQELVRQASTIAQKVIHELIK